MDIGQKARRLRDQHGWTLAEASKVSGISISHLSAIEKGNRPNPSFALVVKLSQAYQVPLTYFVDTEAHSITSDLDIKQVSQVSEGSSLYQEIAKRLIDEDALDNPPKLLEILAEYLRDRRVNYKAHAPDETH